MITFWRWRYIFNIPFTWCYECFLHSELNSNRFEVSHVHKVECVVPWLNDTLVFFTISLQLCQQLKDKVGHSIIFHVFICRTIFTQVSAS